MALVRDWREQIEKLDADQINELIESIEKLDTWPIFSREYGEIRTIKDMLKARENFLMERAKEVSIAALAKHNQATLYEAQCLACEYRVDGACPHDIVVEVIE